MKFYGTPNMSIFEISKSRKDIHNIYKHRILLFRFDDNGEFVTTDEKLISKLIRKFKHDETEIKTEIANITFTENVIKAEEVEIKSENSLRHCKKCEFTCDTQGQLLRHYRESHAKEGV